MSSSVFVESNIPPKAGRTSESNLVVVYGKNQINFDESGLNNIIEQKTISSISVVRITSPTHSMNDEEEINRLEELERQIEYNSDRDETDEDSEEKDVSDIEENKSDKEHITGDDIENSNNENEGTSTDFEEMPKPRKKPGRKPKIIKKQKKRRKPKEHPEIVGLHIEQFYVDDVAKEVVKSALKLAGLVTYKRTAETDALLQIIKNDHNYTPFTSPEQMKAKLAADRLEAERRVSQARKLLVTTSGSFRIVDSKKKLHLQHLHQYLHISQNMKDTQIESRSEQANISKPKRIVKIGVQDEKLEAGEDRSMKYPDFTPQQHEKPSETIDEPDGSESSISSNVTDNDRDSDMDFSVNNRNAKTQKKSFKLKRSQQILQQQQLTPELSKHQVVKRFKEPFCNPITTVSSKTVCDPQIVKILPAKKSWISCQTVKKGLIEKLDEKPIVNKPISPLAPMSIHRIKIMPTGDSPVVNNNLGTDIPQSLSSPQNVKKIVINKNLSPKGVFTNLNTLINESSKQATSTQLPNMTKNTVESMSQTAALTTMQTRSKGFLPLGVEAAMNSRLPAQISIQTHQSSSELAAENDKQLDLIDSILQDELQKPCLVDQESATSNKNIPELVKMLESTAEVLDQQKIPSQPSTSKDEIQTLTKVITDDTSSASIADLDITSSPLLNDITADFLQHVVGLIEDDKQFKEEVEKEVLGFENGTISASQDVPENSNLQSLDFILGPTMNCDAVAQEQSPHLVTKLQESEDCNIPSNQTNTSTNTVELLQVVRGNGRIITLPPIEAPTTRAKRRAQVPHSTPSASSTDIATTYQSESSLDGSVYSNSLFASNESLTTQSIKKTLETPIRRSMTKENLVNTPTTSRKGPRRNAASKKSLKANQYKVIDAEASESQEDDDDPKKLWCICRQPHNNRFMICCDVCEDWFHGTCVNITKAMGLEMEQSGIDWKCPKCVKKLEDKNQLRITEFLQIKSSISEQGVYSTVTNTPSSKVRPTTHHCESKFTKKEGKASKTISAQKSEKSANKPSEVDEHPLPPITPTKNTATISSIEKNLTVKQPKSQKKINQKTNFGSAQDTSTLCIVCKKTARENAIYCSDDCIRKYAQAVLQNQSYAKVYDKDVNAASTRQIINQDGKMGKKKNLFEEMLRQADTVAPKTEKINVFERSSGRIICGHSAPTAQFLKKWLQENPTFEVVQPGSVEANEIVKRINKRALQTPLPTANVIDVNVSTKNTFQQPQKLKFQTETLVTQPIQIKIENSSSSIFVATCKQDQKDVKDKIDQRFKEKDINHAASDSKVSQDSTYSSQKPEPIRVNVRRTLKEQLMLRIKESQDFKGPTASNFSVQLSSEEVDQFVKSVESEMYYTFGRDTGTKYKSKYRSLMFNIKDRKNHTLFAKICAKEIEPKQLVKMTPEELASQELAEWRENENKHQLEIIKKSELDLLSCAKNYVLKTHKGEEVIESKTDFVNLDLDIPVEDVVNVLNKSTTKKFDPLETKQKVIENSRNIEKIQKTKCLSKEKEKDRDKEHNRRHKNHRSKDHHRSSQRTHSRKRSRTYSKSPPRSEKRYKIGSANREERHKDTHRDRDRENCQHTREERKSQDHDRQSFKTEEKDFTEKHISNDLDFPKESNSKDRRNRSEEKPINRKIIVSKDVKDQIESPASSSLDSYNLVDKILQSVKTVEEAANLQHSDDENTVKANIQKKMQDPYSHYIEKVSSAPIWNGDINMADIASFRISIHPIAGNSYQVSKLLPKKLEVIGRINKEMVWDYVEKIKKSPTKEIAVVSLIPTAISELKGYIQLYEHLDSRNRLGVIGIQNEHIRDFYIYPLKSKSRLPTILQSPENVDCCDESERPDIFVGIVVLCLSKRTTPSHTTTHSSYDSGIKSSKYSHKQKESFTPPDSPKRRRVSDSQSSKDDEIDIDAIIKAPIVLRTPKVIAAPIPTTMPSKNDEDEPYSPGDSSDSNDNGPLLTEHNSPSDKEDLKRKVDEINKQIAAQRKEIAGLLNVKSETKNLDVASPSLANILIPPNLSKILASITDKTVSTSAIKPTELDEEYDPEQAIVSSRYFDREKPASGSNSSRLAQLSEAELLRMVPDDMVAITAVSSSNEPPPPGV